MTPAPTVGVVMTVYNGARYVAEAVESIQFQTLADFHLVVVNDGSTDDTMAELHRFRSDPRITVIDSPRIGRVAALNQAWASVAGDYIANLDADDLAHENRLTTLAGFLRERPEVGLVGSACRFVETSTDAERVVRPPTADRDLRSALVRGNPLVHSSVMMQRPAIEQVGGYDPRFSFNHDYALWVSIAERYAIAAVPEVLAVKRRGPHAYFDSRSTRRWRVADVKIRWRAWRRLSRRFSDLPYVLQPIPQALLVRARIAAQRG